MRGYLGGGGCSNLSLQSPPSPSSLPSHSSPDPCYLPHTLQCTVLLYPLATKTYLEHWQAREDGFSLQRCTTAISATSPPPCYYTYLEHWQARQNGCRGAWIRHLPPPVIRTYLEHRQAREDGCRGTRIQSLLGCGDAAHGGVIDRAEVAEGGSVTAVLREDLSGLVIQPSSSTPASGRPLGRVGFRV